jgi:ABC-2 type transport system ATP-binding protein
MQQKVAICVALIREPTLLLLDEPTLGLDVAIAAQLRDLLVHLARDQEKTILVSSHQMNLIEAICDQVVIIQKGKIIAQERVDQLLDLFTTRSYRFRTEQPFASSLIESSRTGFPAGQLYVDGSPTTVEVTLDYGEQLYELMQVFRDHNCIIRSIEHKTPDLEEIFLCLIRENVS